MDLDKEKKDFDFKAKVFESFSKQKFMQLINADLVKVSSGYCEIKLPYDENLTQQHGFFHAGIVSTIADNVAGYAAFSTMESSSSILTVEYKINLIAPAKGDYLYGIGEVIKHGRTLTICKAEVFGGNDENRKLCAIAQSTLIELKNSVDGKK